MSDVADTPIASHPRRGATLAWLLPLVLLVVAGGYAWHRWQGQSTARAQALDADRQRLEALEERLGALRRDQRAQVGRLQQAEATNRLLREELIGLGQRAALVEDTVQKLADPERNAAQALRLDEVELLLAQGQQRLMLAGDIDGSRRAHALAAQLLDGITDPAYLNLRHALTQERSALDALGDEPRAIAAGRLEAFFAALPALPQRVVADDVAHSWWERAFSKMVEVRPSATGLAVEPTERAVALAALGLELTLAQAAIERRDSAGYRRALARSDGWILRLWPDSPERRRQRQVLQTLQDLPLRVDLPTLGSTLEQLRQQRGEG